MPDLEHLHSKLSGRTQGKWEAAWDAHAKRPLFNDKAGWSMQQLQAIPNLAGLAFIRLSGPDLLTGKFVQPVQPYLRP